MTRMPNLIRTASSRCFVALAIVLFVPLAMYAQVHASESPAPRVSIGQSAPANAPSSAATLPYQPLTDARVYRLQDLPGQTSPTGHQSWNITHGTLQTGETVNLHESMQVAKEPPVALHTIQHSEFICLSSGELTFDHTDASGNTVSEKAVPGDVIYVRFGTNHRIWNSGSGPAKYIVIGIGGDAK